MKISTKSLILTAMFTAITIVFAQIVINIGPIPISFSVLAILLAGAILGYKYGTLSIFVYVLLGTVGLPVFAMFSGGPGVTFGPTGGYIIGYISMAFFTGLIPAVIKSGNRIVVLIIGMVLGLLSCYLLGTLWYMIYADISFSKALKICVIPFIPADILKIIVVAIITPRIRKALKLSV